MPLEPQGDLSHLSIEERLTHVEHHLTGLLVRAECRLCRRIEQGW